MMDGGLLGGEWVRRPTVNNSTASGVTVESVLEAIEEYLDSLERERLMQGFAAAYALAESMLTPEQREDLFQRELAACVLREAGKGMLAP
jgi:hypothetical protein